MGKVIEYDDIIIKSLKLNEIISQNFRLTNIKLLENPIEVINNNKQFTLLKIICNKKMKIFLKNIENIFNNNQKEITITFNYDLTKNIDYYELLLNKKIPEIINNFEIEEIYNIEISLLDHPILLWKLYSIEIPRQIKVKKNIKNIDNDIYVENFDPDYYEIQKSFIKEINNILEINNNDITLLEQKNKKLNSLLNEINNNYNFNKIENYRDILNSYLLI